MPALDTNILVRLLVKDDPPQTEAARRLIRNAVAAGEPLFMPVTVTLELEWVLRSAYGFVKSDVIAALAGLLSAADLSLQFESAIEIALTLYGQGSAGFADCLHVALTKSEGRAPLWTFDRSAARVDGACLLETSS